MVNPTLIRRNTSDVKCRRLTIFCERPTTLRFCHPNDVKNVGNRASSERKQKKYIEKKNTGNRLILALSGRRGIGRSKFNSERRIRPCPKPSNGRAALRCCRARNWYFSGSVSGCRKARLGSIALLARDACFASAGWYGLLMIGRQPLELYE